MRWLAIDPHAGYRKALVSSLPRTTITVDVFHAVKLANAAVDDVRRRVQRETLGHRGHNDDPLYGIRRLLTRGSDLSKWRGGWTRLSVVATPTTWAGPGP